MQARRRWMTLAVGLVLAGAWGCGGFGKVNQGRVIAYDPRNGLVTLILDSNYKEPGKPRYDVLPPVTVRVPEDPAAMGPTPLAGGLIELDLQGHQAVIYEAASESLKAIRLETLEVAENVGRNDPRVAGVVFPEVDRAKKVVALYSASKRQLITFAVPEEYLGLPESTWVAGDEVRYYFKDPGQALRMMNVTKTETS
jgi:hypothetical protein